MWYSLLVIEDKCMRNSTHPGLDAGSPGTCLVTGASSGIGSWITEGLSAQGHSLVLPVRNQAKGRRTVDAIHDAAPSGAGEVRLAELDLADRESVDTLIANQLSEGTPIDVLVLNAGVVTVGEKKPRWTVDGHELNFQTNYLGHAELTLGLLPLLQATGGGVVIQSSLAASWISYDWDKLRSVFSYHPSAAYAQSKLALGLFGMELARRSKVEGWGISVQFCHPGIAPGSEIAPYIRGLLPKPLVDWAVKNLGNSTEQAANTALAAVGSTAEIPRLYAPSRWWGMAGPAEERDVFASFDDAQGAVDLWQRTHWLLGY